MDDARVSRTSSSVPKRLVYKFWISSRWAPGPYLTVEHLLLKGVSNFAHNDEPAVDKVCKHVVASVPFVKNEPLHEVGNDSRKRRKFRKAFQIRSGATPHEGTCNDAMALHDAAAGGRQIIRIAPTTSSQ